MSATLKPHTRRPLVLGIDAGGTMTDTFIVAEDGTFTVGKAGTTPLDESVGFMESTDDALSYWGMDRKSLFSSLEVALYSGTTMLNTLLTYRGKRVGLITTRGFEDCLFMGRGLQIYTGYSYADRLHAVTHRHPRPLTERRLVQGVTERIDMFGQPVIPLYENDVRLATRTLAEENVEAISICFLFSYLNPTHERRTREIVHEVLVECGLDIPIFLSSEVRPVIRECSRLNSVMIEAYAAAPVRVQLEKVERAIHAEGFKAELQTVLSYGGLANIRHPRLHETLVSGPVGGVSGGRYVCNLLGIENAILTDMGGTSFDMGVITAGSSPIEPEPVLARFKLNLPTLGMESIGAGSGTIIKIDPQSRKIQLGPESAGSVPGPICFDRGGTEPTVCDCDLVLGYLNPDNFLGGRLKLNKPRALEALTEKVAKPLGVDVYDAAEGIVKMLESTTRDALKTVASSHGLDVSDYYLFGYGGAGPLHLAGYSEGLQFKGIITFPFAAAFSAFGCATLDYLHRYSRSTHLGLTSIAGTDEKRQVGEALTAVWDELEAEARADFKREGHTDQQLEFQPLVMMRYTGQLTDLECPSPVRDARSPEALDRVVTTWEALYERINSRVSKYTEAGYGIFEVGLLASISSVKPKMPKQKLGSVEPAREALKERRPVYASGAWIDASIWEMERLLPGNRVVGPSVIEHSATTLVVPVGREVRVDEYGFFRLETGQSASQGTPDHKR